MPIDRDYDIVLFGATGFTGELTAQYLARHAPRDSRWAIAGRTWAKLEALRVRLASLNPSLADLPMLSADVENRPSLDDLARSARVVISTVGPYTRYGEALVAACAEAGTDYVDLTGEPEFVDRMYVRYHARAVATGARLVHCCGFDSVPHDLGAYFTVGQLPDDVPLRVDGFVRASGRFSGGTLASALTAVSRVPEHISAARDRRRVEPRPAGRSARAERGSIHREHAADGRAFWAVPLPTIDPQIVARSALALSQYGPDFRYSHYAAVRHLPTVVGAVGAVGGIAALAQLPPARRVIEQRVTAGSGPSAEQRAAAWFRVRFVGRAADLPPVVTEVSGGDPGYDETAKMLAESALALAFDELPETAGQVTTAVAMGDALTVRLIDAGIRFTVLSAS